MILGACVAYLVDVMQSRSSEVLAAIMFVFSFCWPFERLNELFASIMRSVVVSISIAASLPMIHAYGTAVTCALCALLIWIFLGYVFVQIRNKLTDNDI